MNVTRLVDMMADRMRAVRWFWDPANRDKVLPFVRAVADAFRFIRDPKNRTETIKLMMEQTGSSEEIARAVMALYFEPDRGVMPRQAEIDLKGLAQVIAFMGEAGALTAPLPPVAPRWWERSAPSGSGSSRSAKSCNA